MLVNATSWNTIADHVSFYVLWQRQIVQVDTMAQEQFHFIQFYFLSILAYLERILILFINIYSLHTLPDLFVYISSRVKRNLITFIIVSFSPHVVRPVCTFQSSCLCVNDNRHVCLFSWVGIICVRARVTGCKHVRVVVLYMRSRSERKQYELFPFLL